MVFHVLHLAVVLGAGVEIERAGCRIHGLPEQVNRDEALPFLEAMRAEPNAMAARLDRLEARE